MATETSQGSPYGAEYSSLCPKCGWPRVVHGDPQSRCRPRYKCPPPFDLMVRDAINRLKDNGAI